MVDGRDWFFIHDVVPKVHTLGFFLVEKAVEFSQFDLIILFIALASCVQTLLVIKKERLYFAS